MWQIDLPLPDQMEQSLKHLLAHKTSSLKTESAKSLSQEHSLSYDELHNCVISEWQGFVSKQSLIEGSMQSLRFLKENYCPNLLIDHRRVHGTWADMSDWQLHIWLPNALQAGLKKYALVANSGSYSALVMELSFERLAPEFEVMHFSDLKEAKIWLAGF